jgi:hypothetical protein
MRWIACAAVTCALLSGAALAQDKADNKEEQLEGTYTYYLKAQSCSLGGFSFNDADLQLLFPAMKQYAAKSGVSKPVRDRLWDTAKRNSAAWINDKNGCEVVRNKLSEALPGVLASTGDNPF